jgi:hypothetical protein
MISTFHCRQGEYKALRDEIEKRWVIASVQWGRDEWHLTAVLKDFLFSLPEERQTNLMRKLAFGKETKE